MQRLKDGFSSGGPENMKATGQKSTGHWRGQAKWKAGMGGSHSSYRTVLPEYEFCFYYRKLLGSFMYNWGSIFKWPFWIRHNCDGRSTEAERPVQGHTGTCVRDTRRRCGNMDDSRKASYGK